MPNFRTEFPDFNPDSLPPLPEAWEDVSYRNDPCPSFCTSDRLFQIFVDYENPEDREDSTIGGRFVVFATNGPLGELLVTDVWREVLGLVQWRNVR